MKAQLEFLKQKYACSCALDWLNTQPDFSTAWKNCNRTDWMLWLLGRVDSVNRKTLVQVACAIARTVLKYVPPGEDRPLKAIEAAEGWVRGEVSLRAVNAAAEAAYAAAVDIQANYADAYAADADADAYAEANASDAADAAAALADARAAASAAYFAACAAGRAAYAADAAYAIDAAHAAYATANAANAADCVADVACAAVCVVDDVPAARAARADFANLIRTFFPVSPI